MEQETTGNQSAISSVQPTDDEEASSQHDKPQNSFHADDNADLKREQDSGFQGEGM